MATLNPYNGTSRKLVLAIDVGTTFSGVSYSILDPGVIPTVHTVSRFPGQAAGDAKIPSVVLYNKDGSVYAIGAEASDDAVLADAQNKGLIFVEWFKLHLRPSALADGGKTDMQLRPLPKGKTAVDVFADVLKYLLACTKTFIQDSHPNGESLWNSVASTYEVILTHPNGWGGSQQTKMRDAAVRAKLIPDTTVGAQRLQFLTEGEASMNYCVSLGMPEIGVKTGTSVIIIDAGGGTVDLSAYKFKTTGPLVIEEIAPAECLLHGSTTINMRAETLLRSKLANSKYNREEDFAAMIKGFEWATKRRFKNAADKNYIKFGRMSDNDRTFGVNSGQMSLTGAEVATMFQPSIDAIVSSVKAQCEASAENITLAFLVGGFAASPYLFSQLQMKLSAQGITVSRPNTSTNKAVADGAIWHHLGRFVVARVARWTYGTECITGFDKDDPEHRARKYKARMCPVGILGIPESFAPVLRKGTRMPEDLGASKAFCCTSLQSWSFPNSLSVDILCYRGSGTCPNWLDEQRDDFAVLCTIEADTSKVDVVRGYGLFGPVHIKKFDVVLTCGQTEMKAFLRWKEDGVEKRSEAKIVYQDDMYCDE